MPEDNKFPPLPRKQYRNVYLLTQKHLTFLKYHYARQKSFISKPVNY